MEDMQSGIQAILNNPQMMEQIMSMAQSMGATPPPEAPVSNVQMPEFDPAMLQRLSGLAGSITMDKNQQNLIQALSPYISHKRIEKLEKAMRAAKLASLATSFLGNHFLDPSR